MKTFGLFQLGKTEPLETFRGVLAVLSGTMVTVLGAHLRDYKRELVAEIYLLPGQSVREVKAR